MNSQRLHRSGRQSNPHDVGIGIYADFCLRQIHCKGNCGRILDGETLGAEFIEPTVFGLVTLCAGYLSLHLILCGSQFAASFEFLPQHFFVDVRLRLDEHIHLREIDARTGSHQDADY